MADDLHETESDAPEGADADPEGADADPSGAEEATNAADEAMKARYREALAHKHGSSGAHRTVHGDKGEEAHSQSNGPTQKMFRRKAGS